MNPSAALKFAARPFPSWSRARFHGFLMLLESPRARPMSPHVLRKIQSGRMGRHRKPPIQRFVNRGCTNTASVGGLFAPRFQNTFVCRPALPGHRPCPNQTFFQCLFARSGSVSAAETAGRRLLLVESQVVRPSARLWREPGVSIIHTPRRSTARGGGVVGGQFVARRRSMPLVVTIPRRLPRLARGR